MSGPTLRVVLELVLSAEATHPSHSDTKTPNFRPDPGLPSPSSPPPPSPATPAPTSPVLWPNSLPPLSLRISDHPPPPPQLTVQSTWGWLPLSFWSRHRCPVEPCGPPRAPGPPPGPGLRSLEHGLFSHADLLSCSRPPAPPGRELLQGRDHLSCQTTPRPDMAPVLRAGDAVAEPSTEGLRAPSRL